MHVAGRRGRGVGRRSRPNRFATIERGASEPAYFTPPPRTEDDAPMSDDGRAWRRSSCPSSGCPTRCRRSRRRPTPPGSRGCASAADARGYDRLVVYADREHSANIVVPDRVRPALRGGAPRRRAGRRPGGPRRQRVLRHGRRGAASDAAAPVPGLQPAEPATRPVAAARRYPRRGGHRPRPPGRRGRLEDLRRRRDERRAGLPRRRAARDGRGNRVRSRTPRTCSSMPRTACASSTRSSSSRPSSGRAARRRRASGGSSAACDRE